jgi:Asp-tRNA(Asn)/Glu-tRNA(Gln) amidotransferase A subunit family amidase
MFALIATALASVQQPKQEEPPRLAHEDLAAAARVAGLEFTDPEIEMMHRGVDEQLRGYEQLFAHPLDNSVAPVLGFARFVESTARSAPVEPLATVVRALPDAARPAELEELCYADVPTLAALIRARKVSCSELTDMYLARLKRLDPQLLCVITLCEERARSQAVQLDAELAAGKWRGLLHGLPWGAKDLLATRGIRTTWGAGPYREQLIDADATVVKKLDEAGAILIAKLTLGELAMDDEWFGGTTKNPWKLDQGSSGSSAGPASAAAAGCVAFAIGSETCGSILSPSARCGTSAIRPTYGLVSRSGAMALSWSMDKLGVIARTMQDASIVLAAIAGVDPLDEETIDRRFVDPGPQDVRGWRVGYVEGAWRDDARQKVVLDSLRALGVELVAVELPEVPSGELMTILEVEAATAFDELTRSGRDDELVRQRANAWPDLFRKSRLVPAVEYVRANRVRRELAAAYTQLFAELDALAHPTTSGDLLVALNLTGHPSVCLPAGPRDDGTQRSLAFSGQLFSEARLVALAEAWQRSTGFHLAHPSL